MRSHVSFTDASMTAMMAKVADGMFSENIACEWVHMNKATWSAWIPLKTNCALGQGLISTNGSYEEQRSEAASCQFCLPGSRSMSQWDSDGFTRICSACPSGQAQNLPGQTECNICETGTMFATLPYILSTRALI